MSIHDKINERADKLARELDIEIGTFYFARDHKIDEHADRQIAYEYMDFKNFLETQITKDDYDLLMRRFYRQQAKSMVRGLKKIGMFNPSKHYTKNFMA